MGLVVAAVGLLLLASALVVSLSSKQPAVNVPVSQASGPTALVTITPDGFVPSTLSVTTGTKVVWLNQDVMPHRIAANPYPTRSDLPELYAPKALGEKQTYSFTFYQTQDC